MGSLKDDLRRGRLLDECFRLGGTKDFAEAFKQLFPKTDIVVVRGEPVAITDKELERLG